MTEQGAEEVKSISETSGQKPEDDAARPVKESRWDALLRAATGEM